MTPKQYAELLDYITENNGWNKLYENCAKRHRQCFKYIDMTFDIQTGSITKIHLRFGGGQAGVTFSVDTEEKIKALYEFLDREVR